MSENTTKNFKMKSMEIKRITTNDPPRKKLNTKRMPIKEEPPTAREAITIILMMRFALNFCCNKKYFSIQRAPNKITDFIHEL